MVHDVFWRNLIPTAVTVRCMESVDFLLRLVANLLEAGVVLEQGCVYIVASVLRMVLCDFKAGLDMECAGLHYMAGSPHPSPDPSPGPHRSPEHRGPPVHGTDHPIARASKVSLAHNAGAAAPRRDSGTLASTEDSVTIDSGAVAPRIDGSTHTFKDSLACNTIHSSNGSTPTRLATAMYTVRLNTPKYCADSLRRP